MSGKVRVESVSVYRNWWWAIAGFGIATIALGLRARAAAFSAPYLQLDNLVFMLLFTGIGIWCLTLPCRVRKYLLYDDRLEIRGATGKLLQTVYLKSITGWSEEHIELSKSPDEWVLRVFHPEGCLKLSSAKIRNYDAFRALRRGRRHDPQPSDLRSAWYLCGGVLAIAALLLIPGSGAFRQPVRPELVPIPARLAEDPRIVKSGRSGNALHLKLEGLEAFSVSIGSRFFGETAAPDFITDVHRGDSVLLLLEGEEFRAKILKQENVSFTVKHFRFQHLSPYGLSTDAAVYLDPEAAWVADSEQQRSNAKWCLGIAVVLGSLGISVLVLIVRKRHEIAA